MSPDQMMFEGADFFVFEGFNVGASLQRPSFLSGADETDHRFTHDRTHEEAFDAARANHLNVLLRVLVRQVLDADTPAVYAYYVAQRDGVPIVPTRHRVSGTIYLNSLPDVTLAVERCRKLALLLDCAMESILGYPLTFNERTYFVLITVRRNIYHDHFFVHYSASQMVEFRRILASEPNILLEASFASKPSYIVLREDNRDFSHIRENQWNSSRFLDIYFFIKHKVLRRPNVEPWTVQFDNYHMLNVSQAARRARKLYLLTH